MDTLEQVTVQDVVQIVRRWPEPQRRALLHALVDVVASPLPGAATQQTHENGPSHPPPLYPPRHTLERAIGLLATDEPPPTDEEVEQIIEQARMERAELIVTNPASRLNLMDGAPLTHQELLDAARNLPPPHGSVPMTSEEEQEAVVEELSQKYKL